MIKTFYVIMFIMLLVTVGCNQEQQKEFEALAQEEGVAKTIVAVGDSLTAGHGLDESESYPMQLGKKLQNEGFKHQVINAGVSGETSSGTLSRLEWILTLDPDIIILETGANDGLRGIDPQLVENNIRQMLQLLGDRDIEVLLVGMKMVWNLGPDYVSQFNKIYPELAEEFGVVFMPFFLDGVAMKQELTQSDGVHPNAEGYAVIVENVYPYVLEAIEKREGL